MKTLLLIPSYVKPGLETEVAAGRHPRMDYDALARQLRSQPGDEVELWDYAALDRERHPAVRATVRTAGRDAGLAMMAFLRRGEYEAIFSNSESIAMPLALLLKGSPRRPRHVVIAHRLSPKKKQVPWRALALHRQMDTIFVYCPSQLAAAQHELGIPADKLRLIHFQADHDFFRPLPDVAVQENQLCAAGLEWRDYPTLIEAVADATQLRVRLAAASPWSKHTNETAKRPLPPHVDARRYGYDELRRLYAESALVVVPLYENDFQAGITTILEAMAMGKPVVVTRTTGQKGVIEDGVNGLYVAPGDVRGWREAIERLLGDAELRARLGDNARRWVETHATVDHWARAVAESLRG